MSDLISRQAAIDALMDEVEPFAIVEPGTTCVIGIGVNNDDIVRVLEQLPSAQPECKRGRWVQIQVRTAPYNRISKVLKCSVCGKRKDKYVTWNFCPNCGANMKGEQDD